MRQVSGRKAKQITKKNPGKLSRRRNWKWTKLTNKSEENNLEKAKSFGEAKESGTKI